MTGSNCPRWNPTGDGLPGFAALAPRRNVPDFFGDRVANLPRRSGHRIEPVVVGLSGNDAIGQMNVDLRSVIALLLRCSDGEPYNCG